MSSEYDGFSFRYSKRRDSDIIKLILDQSRHDRVLRCILVAAKP